MRGWLRCGFEERECDGVRKGVCLLGAAMGEANTG